MLRSDNGVRRWLNKKLTGKIARERQSELEKTVGPRFSNTTSGIKELKGTQSRSPSFMLRAPALKWLFEFRMGFTLEKRQVLGHPHDKLSGSGYSALVAFQANACPPAI